MNHNNNTKVRKHKVKVQIIVNNLPAVAAAGQKMNIMVCINSLFASL